MIERTFSFIKADAVERGLVDEITNRIENAGLKIIKQKRVIFDKEKLETIYRDHLEKEFFPKHAQILLSGESIVMLIEGEDAISRMRKLVGATDPKKAERGTIRGDLAPDIFHNVIHAADSKESFEREAILFFPKQ